MPEDYINSDILEGIIYGRVEPHIYAFSTETIPNYMKVGDTYRPIEKRLNEWRKYYPNLERKYSYTLPTTSCLGSLVVSISLIVSRREASLVTSKPKREK